MEPAGIDAQGAPRATPRAPSPALARHTLILGGPGTGKTERLLAAVAEVRASGRPGEALVVAASPAAAAELKRRTGLGAEAAAGRAAAPRVVTVPALALAVLREAAAPGSRPLRVIGRSERLAMLHEFIAGRELASGAPTPADLLQRIDRLAANGIEAARVDQWSAALGDGPFAARQREFAALMHRHDQLLAERGMLSAPGAVLAAIRAISPGGRHARPALLALDDAQQLAPAEITFLLDLAEVTGTPLIAAADDDQAACGGAAAAAPIRTILQRAPDATVIHLERSQRLHRRIADAAETIVRKAGGRLPRPALGAPEGGSVALTQYANPHDQANGVAAEVARAVGRGVRPERIAIVCVDPARDARAIALALEARGVAGDAVDLDSDARRPEVRDLLAWIRMLLDPFDAGASVRALSRPPVDLPGPDLARIVRVARRRRVTLVEAVREAVEGPGLEPRSRERAYDFLALADQFAPRIDEGDAQSLLRDLIAAIGLHRRQLAGTGPDSRAAVRALRRVEVAASGHAVRDADATPRDVFAGLAALLDAGALPVPEAGDDARRAVRIVGVRLDELRGIDVDELYLAGADESAVAALDHDPVEPLLGDAGGGGGTGGGRARRLLYVAATRARNRLVVSAAGDEPPSLLVELAQALGVQIDTPGATPADNEEELLLQAAGVLRDRLWDDISRAAAGISDLRLDTDVDLTHAVVRVLELVKVAALLGRDQQAGLEDAIAAVNHQLGAVVSPMQRELLSSSDLDEQLRDGRRVVPDSPHEPSLSAFLPRRGEGIGLSATDISTYLACPLQYKFGRVLKVPRPQTVQQRFGIAVHQAIERFHLAGGGPLPRLLALFDTAWQRGGFSSDEESLQFRLKAERALRDYHARLALGPGEPTWVERPFDFRIGRHALRGRVDRVDRLPDGGYELIDIKTGPPREASELQRDVQLALYDLAAREAWKLEPTLRSYYYVMDDQRVQLASGVDAEWVTATVEHVGASIEAEEFGPTPSAKACGWCDFRLACPAAER